MNADPTLPGTDTTDEHARAVRMIALAAAVQLSRERRGWSAAVAAKQAGVGHTTIRRLEDGQPVQGRTYSAVERLLDLPFGALRRALATDAAMVQTLVSLEVLPDAEAAGDPRAVVERFAETATGERRDLGPGRAAVVRDPLPGETEAMRGAPRAPRGSDLAAAAELVERIARRPRTARLDAAAEAIVAAMLDLVDRPPADERTDDGGSSS